MFYETTFLSILQQLFLLQLLYDFYMRFIGHLIPYFLIFHDFFNPVPVSYIQIFLYTPLL